MKKLITKEGDKIPYKVKVLLPFDGGDEYLNKTKYKLIYILSDGSEYQIKDWWEI